MRGGAGRGRQTRNGVLAQNSHLGRDGNVLSVRQLVYVVAIVVVVGRWVGEALQVLSVKMGIMGIDAGGIVGLVALGAGVRKLALEWMAEIVESGDIGEVIMVVVIKRLGTPGSAGPRGRGSSGEGGVDGANVVGGCGGHECSVVGSVKVEGAADVTAGGDMRCL